MSDERLCTACNRVMGDDEEGNFCKRCNAANEFRMKRRADEMAHLRRQERERRKAGRD